MRRVFLAGLAAAFFVITTGQGGYAMSKSGPKPLAVACTTTSPKARLPEWLCPLFIERLAAAHPDRAFTAAQDGKADVELLVNMASSRRFGGHIRWNGHEGEPRAAMLSGGQLGPEILSRTLDQMIAVTPVE